MPRHAKRARTPAVQGRTGGVRVRRLHWGRLLLLVTGFVVLSVAAVTGSLVAKAVATLPPLASAASEGQTSVIYDAAGQPVVDLPTYINSSTNGSRTAVPLSQIPKDVQDAVIASEDRYFYSDHGFNLRGILRAAVNDARGRPLQGGSTITQQLAKQLYLTPQDSLTRKIKEALLGIELARHYTHAQILDMYLNWIYLGSGAYGVQAASETYFGKPVSQLDLAQAALLGGLPPAPTSYDPQVNPTYALQRRNTVLALMAQQHYVTAAQAKAAEAQPLGVLSPSASQATSSDPYPWYTQHVVDLLETQYHFTPAEVFGGGLKIYTALNPAVYDAAQAAVTQEMHSQFPTATAPKVTVNGKTVSDPMQAAVVMMNQSNGDVLAIIGGRSYTSGGQDLATTAEEQTGSAIKPLVDYIPALLKGYTAGTTVTDAVHVYTPGPGQVYAPQDYNQLYEGLTTFTGGLRRSVNTMAVQVLNKVGVSFGVTEAQKLGLVDLKLSANNHLSVALGGTVGCCTPLEMADAYATIANGGQRVTPRFITKVVGPGGSVLLNVLPQWTPVLDPRVAYVMTKMLETVDMPQPDVGWAVNNNNNIYGTNWGTGYDGQVQDLVQGGCLLTSTGPCWPEAAKTGTTNSNRQAWYMAYTPLYTGAVYVGQNYPLPNPNMFGDLVAGPILTAAMNAALQGQTPVHFTQPPGIVKAPIDIYAPAWHVAKPGPLTPAKYIRQEWFVAGTQPTQTNPLWEKVNVDPQQGNSLWRLGCPGTPVTKVYLNVGTKYTTAWAKQIAKEVTPPTSNWQQFLPYDLRLAPPTAWCQGPGLPPVPPSSSTSSGSSGSGASSGSPSGTPSGQSTSFPQPATCAQDWTLGVGANGALTPDSICVPVGKLVQLQFSSTDGRAHRVLLTGYLHEVFVPAQGPPLTVSFRATRSSPVLIVDLRTGKVVGEVFTQQPPTA